MLALSFTFPAGRYHATPWDRHVNEGAVSWPPEPWRLLRGLIATWHHKLKHTGEYSETTLSALIESLAQEVPEYRLPAASHSHTRHYMPQWKPGDTSLVFDAFAVIDRDQPLYVTWPHLDLPNDQRNLLDALLATIGYLGRSESWVEAVRIDQALESNCIPAEHALDPVTGELRGEVVTLLAPVTANEYQDLRGRFLTGKSAAKKLASTLPDTLLAAISVDTAELRKQGWSQPPASRTISYLRPVDALRPKRKRPKDLPVNFTTVRYMLVGKPLPRVEDSVRMGELLRQAVMSRAKDQLGADAIPPLLSGHDLPADNRGRHAFFLPWDGNGDGCIDRLILHVPAGLGVVERRILETLRRIWSNSGNQWQLVMEGIGNAEIGGPLLASAVEWKSITPYLHPWHCKKNFSIEDQIRRECRMRSLPEPIFCTRLNHIPMGRENKPRRPVHFHRFRSKRGLVQPDTAGSFWRIRFEHPQAGPLALGYGSHFGLGLFAPESGHAPSKD